MVELIVGPGARVEEVRGPGYERSEICDSKIQDGGIGKALTLSTRARAIADIQMPK
jgi:hypothetical protein